MTWGKTLVLSLAVILGFVTLGLLQRFLPQLGRESRPGEAAAAMQGAPERYRIVSIKPSDRQIASISSHEWRPLIHAQLIILDTATGYTFSTTVRIQNPNLNPDWWRAYDEK